MKVTSSGDVMSQLHERPHVQSEERPELATRCRSFLLYLERIRKLLTPEDPSTSEISDMNPLWKVTRRCSFANSSGSGTAVDSAGAGCI